MRPLRPSPTFSVLELVLLLVQVQVLLISFLFVMPKAYAWPPTFGIELTFTNDSLINEHADPAARGGALSRKTQENWVKLIQEKCPLCAVYPVTEGKNPQYWKVTYPDGWWYNINVDPGVIEIQARPFTLEQFNSGLASVIQMDIFDLAGEIGLSPHEQIGGGHIHLGLSESFGDNPNLLRNFYVDFHNNVEIFDGVLYQDSGNAPSLGLWQRWGLARALKIFDQEMESNRERKKKVKTGSSNIRFAELVGKMAHYRTSTYNDKCPRRYQALNLERIAHFASIKKQERTLEIRSLNPQKNAKELGLILTMLEARLDKLKQIKTPLPYIDKGLWGYLFHTEQKGLDIFYRYVTELGLDWEDYKTLLPSRFKEMIPTPLKRSSCSLSESNLKEMTPEF